MTKKLLSKPEIKKKVDLIDSKSTKIATAVKRKVPLKSELTIQFKELKEKYDTLNYQNIQNVETIKKLESKVRELENKDASKGNAPPSVRVAVKETQTQIDMYLKCNECNFETPNDTVLDWHLSKIHGWSNDKILDFLDTSTDPRNCKRCDYEAESKYDLDAHTWTEHEEDEDETIVCNLCEKTFSTLGHLMQHKKTKHSDKVSSCWKYVAGKCSFGEEQCWFLHNSKKVNDFKCSICDEMFNTQKDLMKHRKSEHINVIKKCKNYDACLFKKECWYTHEDIDGHQQESNDKNENIIQQLFEVVEKFTEKVTRLEKISSQNIQ